MKANYPAEYMTAVLTAESGDIDKISPVIAECKRMGFEVLPPDVNESFSDFTVVVQGPDLSKRDKIRFGLRSIKNFGEEIGKAIIRERKAEGIFKSYSDFLMRVQHKNLTKKSLEALILVGALDNLGERGAMLANIEEALAFNRSLADDGGNQTSLFGASEISAPVLHMREAPPTSMVERLHAEKELLGLYISGHPLDQHKDKLNKNEQTISKLKELAEGVLVVSGGLVTTSKMILTKKGDKMIFATLEDFTDNIELVCFSSVYEELKDFLTPGQCIAVRGKLSRRNGTPSIVVEKAKKLE